MPKILMTMVAAASLAAVPPALSQVYPSKPVRLIVPFAGGGSPDAIARIVADKLSPRLGQPIIVENRAGADSIIGFDAVAKASPDGHTILFNTSGAIVLLPHTRKALPFDPANDFLHVAQLVYVQYAFAVNPSFPATNIAELIAFSRSKPGKVSYATASETAHVTGEMFRLATGADLLHVPYRVASQAVPDLLSGQIDMLIITFNSVMPHLKSGKLKVAMVSGDRRSPALPNVPTVRESGVRDFESSGIWGLSAPAKTPPAIVKKLGAEAIEVMRLPDVAEKLLGIGVDPRPAAGDQYAALLRADSERWRGVLQRIGFKPE